MQKNNKKILIVVAPINFQDLEYEHTREELEKAGFDIKIASLQSGIARGALGAQVQIDFMINEINENDFDAVIFIGGGGMIELVDNEELYKLAKKFAKSNKITAAICIAPMILANAGLLNQKKGTVHISAKNDYIAKGINYTGELVTTDGNIITASGPDAARNFGKIIVEKLND